MEGERLPRVSRRPGNRSSMGDAGDAVQWAHIRSVVGRKAKRVTRGSMKGNVWMREAALAALHTPPGDRTPSHINDISKYFYQVPCE